MTPKEAEEKYGKENVQEMWEEINLYETKITYSPNGLDLPKHVWEDAFIRLLLQNEKIERFI